MSCCYFATEATVHEELVASLLSTRGPSCRSVRAEPPNAPARTGALARGNDLRSPLTTRRQAERNRGQTAGAFRVQPKIRVIATPRAPMLAYCGFESRPLGVSKLGAQLG